MKYAEGRFTVIEEISLLPEKCITETKASAVRMSADGRFLVATNRGFDSLVVIEVDGKGGMKKNQTTLSGAVSPRDVNFLPDGRHFAAANEFSDVIYFFDFDPEKGTLAPNGLKLVYPRPLCIAWSGK
jgi:6-phosphogluconolactonase